MVITEHSYISPEGKASRNQVSIAQDDDIPGLRRIASAIHQNGSKAIAQINHAGGQAKSEVTGHKSISASAVKTVSYTHLAARARIPRPMPIKRGRKGLIRHFSGRNNAAASTIRVKAYSA